MISFVLAGGESEVESIDFGGGGDDGVP